MPKKPNSDDKKPLRFRPPPASKYNQFDIIETPCNHCIACENLRSLRTAMQLACELNTATRDSWFVTLTYSDEHLPADFSVHKEHIQLFLKRLRKWRNKYNYTEKFRYLSQGEYGGQFGRPHYHLAAFNLTLNDLEETTSKGQYPAFESEKLNEIWGKGNVHLIRLSYESCLYIARHHLDEKINNKVLVHKIPIRHPITREIIKQREPEFTTRSSRPGIGKEFFEKYFSEIYVSDSTIHKGQEMPVPKYFDKLLQDNNPELYEEIKQLRSDKVEKRTPAQNRYQDKFNRAKLRSFKTV